jgi:hypothetical protein
VVEQDSAGSTARDVYLDIASKLEPGVRLNIDDIHGQTAVAAGIEVRAGLLLEGDAGDFLAAYNAGAIVVLKRGKAGAYLGYAMTAGEVGVVGNVGEAAAAYAAGGRVLVYGDAGPRAGWRLAGASLVVKGDAGEGAAAGMVGGEVALLGAARGLVGEGMVGGTLFVRRDASLDTSSVRAREIDAEGGGRLKALAGAVKVTAIDPKAYVMVVPIARQAAPPAAQGATGKPAPAGARVKVVRPGASADEAKAFVDSVVARVEEDDG